MSIPRIHLLVPTQEGFAFWNYQCRELDFQMKGRVPMRLGGEGGGKDRCSYVKEFLSWKGRASLAS